jgi:hypothetical protein
LPCPIFYLKMPQLSGKIKSMTKIHAEHPYVGTYYGKYFQYLAENHPKLRHRKESGGQSFYVIEQAQVKELEILRTGINPAGNHLMLLVIPTEELREGKDGIANCHYTAAFLMLEKYTGRVNEPLGMPNVYARCKQISLQMAKAMTRDSRAGNPLFHRSIDRLDSLNLKWIPRKVENWAGYLVTFNFQNRIPDVVPEDCQWINGGLPTPFTL